LDVLAKRISFGKRRITTLVILFQSVVTIVLISYVLVVNRQASYMEGLPIGWWVFAAPIIIQCLMAALVTWGVSLKVLSGNPVEALKNE
jgi:putative ABC transport system permease protein